MKKYIILIPIVLAAVYVYFNALNKQASESPDTTGEVITQEESSEGPDNTAQLANPASVKCEDDGGELKMISDKEGNQTGVCVFSDYECEEWAYYRGECNLEEDAAQIKEALIAKGLNLNNMKVVINKHFGKYIGGSVVPISEPAGGGYVFAVKTEDGIVVLAHGNGQISCSAFEDYQDFPSYLVSGCVDETGNPVER